MKILINRAGGFAGFLVFYASRIPAGLVNIRKKAYRFSAENEKRLGILFPGLPREKD